VCNRVWDTAQWTPERWTIASGHVQTACWSPCGSILLFATSEEPIIYSLTFCQRETVFQHDDASKTAVSVVDLTEVEVNEGERLVILIVLVS
jgi:aladin